jgi:hypothetical protein
LAVRLRHQVLLGLQAARRVHDHVIHVTRLRRLKGVEKHRAGVAAGTLADEAGLRAFGPDLKLLDGRRPERIRRAQQRRTALLLEAVRELSDGRGLSRPVHADHQDHRRRLGHSRRNALAGLKDLQQMLPNEAAQFRRIVHLMAFHPLANPRQNLLGGPGAYIRGDERGFQLVEQVRVDDFLALDSVFERGNQPRARLFDAAFQFFQKGRFPLDGTEQRLDHFRFIVAAAGNVAGARGEDLIRGASNRSSPTTLPWMLQRRSAQDLPPFGRL